VATPTHGDRILAAALVADAAAHETGQFEAIGEVYDDVYRELLAIQDLKERRFGIALNFWDGWADARNHDWFHYPGIAQSDWPRLARGIAEALENGVDPTDAAVVARFAPENLLPLRTRLSHWWARL
jgi:hypothetical protein